ncbi:MAG: histidine phosphatase family protein [Hyphomicrobiales bacterium]|nr:histidine phosphatase family protein [Hyphomicrobiales bacterium]
MQHSAPLFFIRHGETFYNAEGRLQGQLDTELSPRGRRQAGEAARRLAQAMALRGLDPARAPYSASPLMRTVETMELMREALGLPRAGFVTDPRLIELSFGRWQNMTWPEIRTRDPMLAAARDRDKWDFTPPGGESYATLTARVGGWLGERVPPQVVVAHGGVARALMTLLGGMSPEQAANETVLQGRVLVFAEGRAEWV